MGNVNKVIVLGNVGKDPELKSTTGGSSVTNFSVATHESWKDKEGQDQRHTEWHKIVVFGKLAELCTKYVHKGNQVYVEGKLQTRKFKDKDGTERDVTEIRATDVVFLTKLIDKDAEASTDESFSLKDDE